MDKDELGRAGYSPAEQGTTARYLMIVARDWPALFDELRQTFSGDSAVRVFLDRRRWERRLHFQWYEPERRRADRRVNKADIQSRGFLVVRREDAPSAG